MEIQVQVQVVAGDGERNVLRGYCDIVHRQGYVLYWENFALPWYGGVHRRQSEVLNRRGDVLCWESNVFDRGSQDIGNAANKSSDGEENNNKMGWEEHCKAVERRDVGNKNFAERNGTERTGR